MTARTPSKLGISEERTCFCIVRRCVTTLRLRSERFNVWRVRLAADLVLAIDYKKLWTWTLAVAIAIVKGMAAQMVPTDGLFLRARTEGGYRALIQDRWRFICWASLALLSLCSERSRHSHLLDRERSGIRFSAKRILDCRCFQLRD